MKRRHPVRRVVLSTAATVSGIVVLIGLKPTASTGGGAQAGGAAATGAGQRSGAAAPASASGASPKGVTVTVTVTGKTVQTKYGPVQVRLTFTGGRITAATALQHPTGNKISDKINAHAVPALDQETLTAQSATIAAVSGASYTSAGYKQSLQSAIDETRA